MLDAVRRFNGDHLDTTGVYRDLVMERCLIKVAVDRAEVSQIRSATGYGIEAPAGRRLVRYAAQRSNEGGNGSDPDGLRHILILEI